MSPFESRNPIFPFLGHHYFICISRGKYVVLLFYPEDFSWVCPTEILAYSERADELREAGAEVIGVSCDSANTHLAYVKTDQVYARP